MKIVQITTIVENRDVGSEDAGTWKRIPDLDATVYGLGNDQKVYYYGVVSREKVTLDEPDEDGNTYYYENKYGWKPYGE